LEEGKIVRVGEPDTPELARWAERQTLAEMRRATVAELRGEAVAVAPEIFADFLLRRQYVHPATRGEGPEFVEVVLENLQALSAAAAVWEGEILPRRIKGYRPAWLDDLMSKGAWLWRGEGSGRDDPRIAFFLRDFDGHPPLPIESIELSADARLVCGLLERHGASFATDLARLGGIEPTRVRRSLRELTSAGLATNDRFDAVALTSGDGAAGGAVDAHAAPAVVEWCSGRTLVSVARFERR
jgi:ATP-dependent Lhr-like helicase